MVGAARWSRRVVSEYRTHVSPSLSSIANAFEKALAGAGRSMAAIGFDALRISKLGHAHARVGLGSVVFLAMSSSMACAERFSVKCAYHIPYYVSFDTESGKVVHETPAGSVMTGRVDKIDGERIYFHLVMPGEPNFDLIWDGHEKSLAWLAIPNNSRRRDVASECAITELRSMLSK
jgi:hypothetical protein